MTFHTEIIVVVCCCFIGIIVCSMHSSVYVSFHVLWVMCNGRVYPIKMSAGVENGMPGVLEWYMGHLNRFYISFLF